MKRRNAALAILCLLLLLAPAFADEFYEHNSTITAIETTTITYTVIMEPMTTLLALILIIIPVLVTFIILMKEGGKNVS